MKTYKVHLWRNYNTFLTSFDIFFVLTYKNNPKILFCAMLFHVFSELLTSGDETPSSGHQGNALFTMESGGGSYET